MTQSQSASVTTDPGGPLVVRASAVPGHGSGVVSARSAALIAAPPDDPRVGPLIDAVLRGVDFDTMAGIAAANGFVGQPAYGIAVGEPGGLRVLVRGAVEALITTDGQVQRFDGANTRTWTEHLVGLDSEVRFEVAGDATVGAPVEVGPGITRAATITVATATPTPERASAVLPAAPPPPEGDGRPSAAVGAAVGAADAVDLPTVLPDREPREEPTTAGPRDPAEETGMLVTGPIPASAPETGLISQVPGMGPPRPPDVPVPSEPAPPAAAAPAPPTAATAPPPGPVIPPSRAPDHAPAVSSPVGHHDGGGLDDATISLAARRAEAAVPRVQAVLCPSGHPNPPHADVCRTCRATITDRLVCTVARPSLGRLRFDDGTVAELDRHLVIGRRPESDPLASDGPSELVTVADPEGVVSRTHVVVRIEGWQVQVIDRGSTNNTFVSIPGRPAFQLRPGDPYPIPPDTRVLLGDEVGFTYDGSQR